MGLKWLIPVVFAYNFVYNKLGQRLQPGLVGVQPTGKLNEQEDTDEFMEFLPLFLAPDVDEFNSTHLSFSTPSIFQGRNAETASAEITKEPTEESDYNYLMIGIIGLGFLLTWSYLSYKQ